jgi:uncharacterized protein (TIGR03083 family)
MDWIAELEALTKEFATALADGDLNAGVPACPNWTLADLGEHLRCVHLWAAQAVTDGHPDGWPTPGMLDRRSLVAGYRAAASQIVAVLSDRDTDDPAWAFGPKPHTAGFWHRRQTHETLVHLYDALEATGWQASWSVSPALAWDGAAEVATMFYPREVDLGRRAPLPGTLGLVATDVPGDPITIGEGTPIVEVVDTADRLLLMLWNRLPFPAEADPVLNGTPLTP